MNLQKILLLKKPILITGAAGFIGANFCKYFLARGFHVTAVEHTTFSSEWRLRSMIGLRRLTVDLCSKKNVRRLVKLTSPSVVINCAAYGAYSCQTNADRIYRVNFDVVRYLLESLRQISGFNAFIQAGTSSEYGENCSAPSEDAAVLPDSDYAASKVAASTLIQYYGKVLRFPAWSLRIYSVYGPYEEISRLVPTLLLKARDGEWPPLVSPNISRDFIYVDDLADAVLRVIQKSNSLTRGEIYNIGTGRKTTLAGLVQITRKLFKIKARPIWKSMPDRHWDNPGWYGNPRKAKTQLGWSARTDLEQGLKKTMQWLNAHPECVAEATRHSLLKKKS